MSILRQAIRKLILEVDMGEHVWAFNAPYKSRHRSAEEDTPIEAKMYKQLKTWVQDEKDTFTDDVVQGFLEASDDPKYNDVISTRVGGKYFPDTVYRGSPISRHVIEELTGLRGKDLFDAVVNDEVLDIEFTWDNQKFHRPNNIVSSWTGTHHVAQRFSLDDRHRIPEPIACIFHVDVKHPLNVDSKFLNMKPIYMWGGFMNMVGEDELLALSNPVVSRIEFISEALVSKGMLTGSRYLHHHNDDFKAWAQKWHDENRIELDDDWLPF